ncbi:propionate CoA-transferase [Leminorella grimontii]|uniref:Acetate CoA-transferase YdiF n=1 Tax=Leminorella grimontii TaxID=82981 RepID=A0AAV5N113_9GAMM|nr:CoA-transferase [Leminorella grimontii]KFC97911.1 acetyl-CoA:acetoacetyl-CoA transferase, alpha subunit [Leminorella grimontii ATCC 33999 = DSM 5078]GKX55432.1 propionate CoA-transferase [Leminorella grimontii]VFS56234.1 Acetate CoA-transferase subunit beta [Leminorella grimontii]
MAVQFVSLDEFSRSIQDGDRLVLGGFIGAVVPEALEKAIGSRFRSEGHPRNLSLYFAAGQGDSAERAVNNLAEEGLVSFAIGGHWGLIPRLQKLANEGKITGYNLPQGVIAHLMRDTAAGKPGTLSHVGLGTFVDPRIEGGKINKETKEDWVEVITIHGKEYLFYKRLDANVALLRGTTADENGNISMEDECLFVENLAAAQMVKNNGGRVIVQVKRKVKAGTLEPQSVRIPGILVDMVVVVENEADHMQTFAEQQNDAYCRLTPKVEQEVQPIKLDAKKVVARRAAQELKRGAVLNLGIGLPEYISAVVAEEGLASELNLTVEPGAIGGTPAGGLSFGASANPEAIVTQDQQFDFYDGGGIDQAFLGLAECDKTGDLNVSRFGTKIPGCGGFINITQNAKEVFFCGTFTAGKFDIQVADGKLSINKDGEINKFIDKVQQITFSAKTANENKKPVLYITERAVFRLIPQGLELIEIAPGVSLENDVLAKMDFVPTISPDLKVMDEALFHDRPIGLQLK